MSDSGPGGLCVQRVHRVCGVRGVYDVYAVYANLGSFELWSSVKNSWPHDLVDAFTYSAC